MTELEFYRDKRGSPFARAKDVADEPLAQLLETEAAGPHGRELIEHVEEVLDGRRPERALEFNVTTMVVRPDLVEVRHDYLDSVVRIAPREFIEITKSWLAFVLEDVNE